MAVKTFYLQSGGYQCTETDPGTEGYCTGPSGWVVGTGAGPDYSAYEVGTEKASSTFGATVHPDATLVGGVDYIWFGPLTGTFDAGNWTVDFAVRAQTNGGAHDGNAGFRIHKSDNPSVSNPSEITSAVQVGSTVTNLATSATQTSSATIAMPAVTLNNQYIHIEIGWKRTGAGGMANSDVNVRYGTTGTKIVTTNFSVIQTLTPGLFTDDDTFYSPTVGRGAVGLTPGLFTDGDTFYAPTVAQVTPLTQASRFDNSNTFYAPTVSVGAVNLTPGLYTDTDTFYSPTVSPGAVGLTPGLFTDDDTFYSATVSLSGSTQELTASLYTDSDTFYAPTVAVGAVTLAPGLFTNSPTFYEATITGGAVPATARHLALLGVG